MDFEFENVQGYDPGLYLEFRYRVTSRKVLLWGVISLILAGAYGFDAMSGKPWSWIITVIFLGVAVYYFITPYLAEKKRYNEYLTLQKGTDAPNRIRFGEQIVAESNGEQIVIDYRELESVLVLNRAWFLRFDGNAYLCVDPNAFTKGTFVEFVQFLRQKCPDLNIPHS